MNKYLKLIDFIRAIFSTPSEFIPLHEPRFRGNEKKYLLDAIDSTFVSSVGEYVDRFEKMICDITGAKYAVATVNGTAALHSCLLVAGVKPGDEVITQALSFIATVNAISYCGASPVFIDVDKDTLGLSAEKVGVFLSKNTIQVDGECVNTITGKRISAVVPMHTFGHPVKVDELVRVCAKYNIPVVEDAAESLGSYYKGKHTGTFGKVSAFSFNGNKTITSGGGGVLVTDDEELAKKAKHLTTTAKEPHKWGYIHDEIGYNYRMPNLNASLVCAQLELLDSYVANKRELSNLYIEFAKENGLSFIEEPSSSKSNYWLNSLCLENKDDRDEVLEVLNNNGIMCRPVWKLLFKMPMYSDCYRDEQKNAQWFEDRIVNLPSSVR